MSNDVRKILPRLTLLVGRAACAVLFGAAGLSKIIEMLYGGEHGASIWAEQLGNSTLGYAVACAEIALAVWLASGYLSRQSLLCALSLLSLYSGVLVVELRRDRPRPCGCFAALTNVESPETVRRGLRWNLVRNISLMAGIAVLFGISANQQCTDEESDASGLTEPRA